MTFPMRISFRVVLKPLAAIQADHVSFSVRNTGLADGSHRPGSIAFRWLHRNTRFRSVSIIASSPFSGPGGPAALASDRMLCRAADWQPAQPAILHSREVLLSHVPTPRPKSLSADHPLRPDADLISISVLGIAPGLADRSSPRHGQHALVQIGERLSAHRGISHGIRRCQNLRAPASNCAKPQKQDHGTGPQLRAIPRSPPAADS